ncbi:MAG: acetyl-CoA carboxylase carboxyl transferase subunit alpha, partial [Flavobacteriaceae bacterium]
SPEASASILWRESSRAPDAATAMKITAQDLKEFGVIDRIVAEPMGGAHRDPGAAIQAVGEAIAGSLAEFAGMDGDEIRRLRRRKFLEIGQALG